MKALIEGSDSERWEVRRAMAAILPDNIFKTGQLGETLITRTQWHGGVRNLTCRAIE